MPQSTNQSRFINDKLLLFRYSFRNEKISYANEEIRKSFINLLSYHLKDMDFTENNNLYLFLNSYSNHLHLNNFNFLNYKSIIKKEDIKKYINTISKTCKIKEKQNNFLIDKIPFLGKKKYNFKMFYLLNLCFIVYLISLDNEKDYYYILDSVIYNFNLNNKEKELFNEYLNLLKSDDDNLIKKIESLIENDKTLENLLSNIKTTVSYHRLPLYNVCILGTVNSGKSTFLNALLDKDIIPSNYDIHTAKITSISDNDIMDNKIFGGCLLDNNTHLYSNNVDYNTLDTWNNNNSINHIFLEMDIKNIHSKNGILVIHDTPGPNNSRTDTHSSITKDFLKNDNIDLFLYLIDADYLGTTDLFNFLKYFYNNYNKKSKVLFLLNKVDDFERDKDSINNSIFNIKSDLQNIGFENIDIIPISAKGAYLFRKVLKEEPFKTQKEKRDFKILFRKFYNSDFLNLTNYCEKELLVHNSIDSEKNIKIDHNTYKESDLFKVLESTNIYIVKNILNKLVNS